MVNNPFQNNPNSGTSTNSPLSSSLREKFKKANSLEELIRSSEKPAEVMAYIMEGNDCSTLDEANSFLEQIQNKWNETPRPELFEHSPSEAAYLLYDLPYKITDEMIYDIDLSSYAAAIKKAPLYQNWIKFLSFINSNEVGATARGNLNRKAISALKDILDLGKMREEYKDWIRNEDDWEELCTLRSCAEFTRLIKRRKSKWSVTTKCKDLLDKDDYQILFLILLDGWFNKLDWRFFARTTLLEKVELQRNRYLLLSALLRMASSWMNYYEFMRTLHNDFLKLNSVNNEIMLSDDVRDSHLGFLFHYPLFAYLYRMNVIDIDYKTGEDKYFDTPNKFKVTNLGKCLIKSLLNSNESN